MGEGITKGSMKGDTWVMSERHMGRWRYTYRGGMARIGRRRKTRRGGRSSGRQGGAAAGGDEHRRGGGAGYWRMEGRATDVGWAVGVVSAEVGGGILAAAHTGGESREAGARGGESGAQQGDAE